ncbi:hypothetical protein GCM10009665_01580 [Kitasatospora nipponensis]|uniref:Uncharacterized protein n=1 Tax=Kitasatospora nipponensis TaxID=258049 RepID=A0ABP4GBB1_9ACTN
MRPPVRLTRDVADHLDALMGIEAPGDDRAVVGVVRGWSQPLIVPVSEVLGGSCWSDVRTGVYVPCGDGAVANYVGSVRRATAALAARLREHFREVPDRRERWTHVALVRLPDRLSTEAVLRCEGRAGRALDPLDNIRLPAVPGRPAWVPRPRAA